MNSLNFYKKILIILFASFIGVSFAQPANDFCVDAEEISMAADEASCVETIGTTLGVDASSAGADLNPSAVCSGSWFRDDVWYKFSVGSEVPAGGIFIRLTPIGDTPINGAGISAYASGCDLGLENFPINCNTDLRESNNTLELLFLQVFPNQEIHVRVWSPGSPSDDSGEFSICVFGIAEAEPNDDIVVWGDNGEGEFTGGLNGWTIENALSDSCGWEWQPNGAANRGNFAGAGTGLFSPTSTTGTVVFDSDYLDNNVCSADQFGNLVSPDIDLTGFENDILTVSFWQAYRNFSSVTRVEASVDGGMTWEGSAINTEVAVNATSTVIQQEYIIPFRITEGMSSMKIRFNFEANYYYWVIDDVRILGGGDCHDLVAPANDFFAIPPDYVTPASQVQPMAFLNDVANIGGCDEDNIMLKIDISDGAGEVIYTDIKEYGVILSGNDFQNSPFTDLYTPPNIPGSYTGTYTIFNGQEDVDSSNNSMSFNFEIGDNTLFSKEAGNEAVLFNINPGLWNDTENKSWGVANYFFFPNAGDTIKSISMGYIGDSTNDGQVFDIFLYRWMDSNLDRVCQGSERTIVASSFVEVSASDGFVFAEYPLESETRDEFIISQEGDHILAAVELKDGDPVIEFNMVFDDEFEYGAMTLAYDSLQLFTSEQLNGHAGMFFTSDADSPDYTDFTSSTPAIRLNLGSPFVISDLNDALPIENFMLVYPNPSRDQLNLDIQLVENEAQARVNIIDIAGKEIRSFEYTNVQQDLFTYDVSDLAEGAYLLQYVSETGSRTMKFTKQ